MNLYHCDICGGALLPDQSGIAHLITGWVRNGKTSLMRITEKQYRYAHAICVESPPKVEQTESLF
jgi:hypothetical protein